MSTGKTKPETPKGDEPQSKEARESDVVKAIKATGFGMSAPVDVAHSIPISLKCAPVVQKAPPPPAVPGFSAFGSTTTFSQRALNSKQAIFTLPPPTQSLVFGSMATPQDSSPAVGSPICESGQLSSRPLHFRSLGTRIDQGHQRYSCLLKDGADYGPFSCGGSWGQKARSPLRASTFQSSLPKEPSVPPLQQQQQQSAVRSQRLESEQASHDGIAPASAACRWTGGGRIGRRRASHYVNEQEVLEASDSLGTAQGFIRDETEVDRDSKSREKESDKESRGSRSDESMDSEAMNYSEGERDSDDGHLRKSAPTQAPRDAESEEECSSEESQSFDGGEPAASEEGGKAYSFTRWVVSKSAKSKKRFTTRKAHDASTSEISEPPTGRDSKERHRRASLDLLEDAEEDGFMVCRLAAPADDFSVLDDLSLPEQEDTESSEGFQIVSRRKKRKKRVVEKSDSEGTEEVAERTAKARRSRSRSRSQERSRSDDESVSSGHDEVDSKHSDDFAISEQEEVSFGVSYKKPVTQDYIRRTPSTLLDEITKHGDHIQPLKTEGDSHSSVTSSRDSDFEKDAGSCTELLSELQELTGLFGGGFPFLVGSVLNSLKLIENRFQVSLPTEESFLKCFEILALLGEVDKTDSEPINRTLEEIFFGEELQRIKIGRRVKDFQKHFKGDVECILREKQHEDGFFDEPKFDRMFRDLIEVVSSSGLSSLGATVSMRVRNALCTAAFILRIVVWLLETFPDSRDLVNSLPKLPHERIKVLGALAASGLHANGPSISAAVMKALLYVRSIDEKHPLVYSNLNLGKNWECVIWKYVALDRETLKAQAVLEPSESESSD